MKLPEPLFVVINPVVRLLLHSPLHGLLSSSVMLIRFRGRRTGKTFVTPVRYIREGQVIRCFTAITNQWWRNMRQAVEVTLRVEGREGRYVMTATFDQPEVVRAALARFLAKFPKDAPYYEIELQGNKVPKPGELDKAAQRTVMVEAVEIQ